VVRDQIRDKLPYPFDDMGEQSVRNIARPVRAYAMSASAVASTRLIMVQPQPASARRIISPQRAAVVASAIAVIAIAIAGWWEWPKGNSPTVFVHAPAIASTSASRLSIVVLPFTNLSSDPDQEYFADAISDDLTTDLSRISGSFVIARTTAFTYKGKAVDVKQIGLDLGVRYILEGSVRRLGEQLQVNVQLIDAENGGHVWADRFDTDRRDLAEAEKAIPARLALRLQLEIVRAAAGRMDPEAAGDLGAQDLILRARALGTRPTSRANREAALQAWERALIADPQSTDARNGIAGILAGNVGDGFSNSISQDLARAEQLLLESLEREPNQSRAHQVMGWLRRFQNRPTEAMAEYETAIALDPNNVAAIRQIGQLLRAMGEPEAAIPYLEKSLRLDPRGVEVFAAYQNLGWCDFMLGNLDEAEEFFTKARAANPRVWFVHLGLAMVLAVKGQIDEARAAIAESLRLNPEINSIARLRTYNARGQGADNPKSERLRNIVEAGLRRAGFPDE
jgi:TolB-like protein/Flp pilus assembly protein TadD